ncbi:hypothetical protein AOQ84DRAFT_150782 [Glonium stellatum]|uniref:PHD-type domain-containing protein n=1 Tax=Glonium stellatum TaxID=574774 RepID=A0A8E2F9S9_9PEZI|nr:hypothetical protein AOQ84DRAFT_150782 [Glonium stellatum]
MNLDQHIYGFTDWHLPSPSSTPKSATFPEAFSQTPKSETFQSHFLDAFSTPRVNGHRTPAQTPLFLGSTTLERPSSSYSHKGHNPEDPEFHVNHFTPNGHLPLPPVEPSRRLSSSPDPLAVKAIARGALQRAFSASRAIGNKTMDTSQMQTPPPTRDSSSRRKNQTLGAELTTPSTTMPRRVSTPATAGHAQGGDFYGQTPLQFPGLQFSPDVIQFPNTGPMSAPAFPQSRLFWDQNNDGNRMDVDVPVTSDAFGSTPHKLDIPLGWQSFGSPSNQLNLQAYQDLNGISTLNQAAPFLTDSMNVEDRPVRSRPSSFISTTSGVDPSLLFSFSNPTNPLASTSFSSQLPDAGVSHEGKQPYEHQVRESYRERELARQAKSQHSRTNTSSSSGSGQGLSRPTLQRSNTDSGFRRGKASSVDSRSSGSSAGHHIPRRSSPLKRQSQGSLTSIPEVTRARPRTRLVIDETGRARTETDPVDDENYVRKDLRSQYPGLWNEDDSDSDLDQPALSRNTSFSIPQPIRRSSKHARADSNLDRSDSFKMPRASSMYFEGSSFTAPRSGSSFDQSNNQNASSNSFRRYSMSSFGASFGEQAQGINETTINPIDSAGDAQGALKKVVEGRLKRNERSVQGTLKAHNQRWAQASSDLSKPSANPQVSYDPFSNTLNGSPSTIADPDFATPSTDRSSLSSEGTRCVCNTNDYDGQLMIQCESCTKWLHVRCVGLNNQNLPPVYVCIFCTGQTPAVRGGRIREPARTMPQYESPLTHKSIYGR